VSPGVPPGITPLKYAISQGIEIIGEIELAYQIMLMLKVEKRGSVVSDPYLFPPHFIGITGTNGKSTVSTLIDMMLKEYGFRSLLCGNIGNSLSEEICKLIEASSRNLRVVDLPDYIVTELSSFQLERIRDFKPRISVILNISPDHLDRYDSLMDYLRAKTRIFMNQKNNDFLIINADDPLLMQVYEDDLSIEGVGCPRVLFFSKSKKVDGIYFDGRGLICNLPDIYAPCRDSMLIDQEEIGIKGAHNLENAMAASLCAMIAGCSMDAIREVLRGFRGLEHRTEFVREINGVRFINDSKGTNVGAVQRSLEGFENVILIMGGRDKGGDFSVLKDIVKKKVKLLILIGEAKERIENALKGTTDIIKTDDLKEAVNTAFSNSSQGDTVLLSPGCASFDMFSDYEERGRKFKEIVWEL
jgi:UDP-N-acetylmuramoylalanine--D-glutamate ligase